MGTEKEWVCHFKIVFLLRIFHVISAVVFSAQYVMVLFHTNHFQAKTMRNVHTLHTTIIICLSGQYILPYTNLELWATQTAKVVQGKF